ncbi:MAG: TetR/AcrR family transcriptional regulator [Egibacteraceae bacterium]
MSTAAQGPLERRTIVATALAIVDAEGLEALSMRRLARTLGVAPMSLYRHVRDKDEVLALVAEAVAELVASPAEDLSWHEAAAALCRSVRAVLLDHRGVARLLLGPIPFTPAVLRLTETLLGNLARAGLRPAQAAAAHEALWMLTVGSVIVEQAPLAGADAAPMREQLARATQTVGSQLPALAAALPHWAALRQGQAFDLGLELLLDGLRRSVQP